MAKYTLDRFEGEKAIILLRKNEAVEKNIKRDQLPKEVKEGDILELHFDENDMLKDAHILKNETDDARKQAKNLLEKLKNKYK